MGVKSTDELLQKYGIISGTRIVIIDNGDSITLKPMTEEYLKKLQGSLKGRKALAELMSAREEDMLK